MGERLIQTADLSAIANNLSAIHDKINTVNANVQQVDSHVDSVESDLAALRSDFDAFVNHQILDNRKQLAETRLVKIRQELDKKFGHYDIVRRTTTGILQATDLGIIRQEIISNATEEMMISTPGYWLAPCLVALSAWICDKQDLAEKATREALKRDDEKTSLFFSLVCRRASRQVACVKWVNRYLMNQDAEQLDRKTILVLAAYANGLWGNDTEGEILRQIDTWLHDLQSRPEAVAKQREQWQEAIDLKMPDVEDQLNYPYLKKYSPTWSDLDKMMSGAYLHRELLDYFQQIFAQENATGKLKEQLDEVLDELVTEFDDEELKYRQEEKLEQLVIDHDGDEAEAKKHMQVAQTAFETHKDFIQLLTDASMNPELAHADAATQKFAISLSRDWILHAYRDEVAANRNDVPETVAIQLDDFNGETTDGTNETELLQAYDRYIDTAQEQVMAGKVLSQFDQACRYIRYVLAAIGVALCFGGMVLYGIVALLLALWAHVHYSGKQKALQLALATVQQLEERRGSGKEILRAILAETVDIRQEYRTHDKESTKVLDFLQTLNPNQFVRYRQEGPRNVMVQKG